MGETYLIRAKLEIEWDFDEKGFMHRPSNLPVNLGPFILDQSPNSEFYFMELGWIDPDSKIDSPRDYNYPVSLLYVETEIDRQTDQHPASTADDTFEQLEAMLRLFQEGDICLRRYDHMWYIENGVAKPFISIRTPPPIKAELATLYKRGPYKLDDKTMKRFIDFFNSYWDIVHQKPPRLYIALYRFSCSYEKRTLADRLTELVIALEALFGDNGDSLTYKIALRCATFTYPKGEAREKAFETIKKIYGERSNILHGEKVDTNYTNEDVQQLEEYVRNSIIRFLEQHKNGNPICSGKHLDSLLFFRKEENSY